jgi:DNA-directed RNA polymerase specialized sigma24 family protein
MVDQSSPRGAEPLTRNNSDLEEQARDGFAQFYAEHRSLGLVVLRVALGGTGIEPDDVSSCMWVKIWETWRERGPLVEAPKAFIRTCARHAAIDALRARTHLLVDVDELDGLAARRWADGASGTAETEQSTLSEPDRCAREPLTDPRLIAAVQALTPIERLVILMSIERSPPPTSAEIARALKIPSANTVRGHRMRGLKKLREIFNTLDQREGGRGDGRP